MEQTTTFEARAYSADGTARPRVTLPADLFDGTVNMPVMHQVVKAFLANQRQSNASTKNRKLVAGGNQKPWRQKGTGRARQGSIRAPHFVGGGTVFGPTNERNYEQTVPRKVKALGRKSALNARARENAIVLIDALDPETPKTAAMRDLLGRLELGGTKVLLLTDGVKPNVYLSARNLPTVHVMPYSDVSTYHVLWSDVVVIEQSALGVESDGSGDADAEASAEQAERAPRKSAAKSSTAKQRTARSVATTGAPKKTAARKAAPRKNTRSAAPKKRTRAAAPRKAAAKTTTAKKTTAKKTTAKKTTGKRASGGKHAGGRRKKEE